MGRTGASLGDLPPAAALCHPASVSFRAVIFDWRGTLVTTLTEREWVLEALRRLGRAPEETPVERIAAALRPAGPRLDPPGLDTDAVRHRRVYAQVFGELGIDTDLAEALYDVESDVRCNRFADDAPATLRRLHDGGLRLAVLSDIHVDIRPAFAAARLAGLVDVFSLSVELGAQKPDPRVFGATLAALGTAASETLIVGDRSHPDGAAVEHGIATLLLPTLRDPEHRRLHLVAALCGCGDMPT